MELQKHDAEVREVERRPARARTDVPPPTLRPWSTAAGNQAISQLVQRWRAVERASGGQLARKDVTIVGKPTLNIPNLGKFKRMPAWKTLIQPLIDKYSQKVVEFHLSQLFSAGEDLRFESDTHFLESLTYDIENKTTEGEHNLQEQYMTSYGWKRRRERSGKGEGQPAKSSPGKSGGKPSTRGTGKPAKGQDKEPEDIPLLKVYRTMKLANWKRLEGGDHTALTGHMGDFKQAHNYLHRSSPEPKVLVEFTLLPGGERALFSGATMAFPDDPGALKVPNVIRETLKSEGVKDSFAVASTNEGVAPGKVGIKAEGGESGFSFGIGGGDSAAVFMKLVKVMNVIGSSKVDPTAKPEQDDQDAQPSGEADKPGKGEGGETSSGSGDGGERQQRLTQFLQALALVPQVEIADDPRVEPADPSNQYVQVGDGDGKEKGKEKGKEPAKPTRYDAARLARTSNPGGGDCLFHAIAGRTLSDAELLLLRQNVAATRNGMPENQALNAQQVAASLTQTSQEYADLMTGRHQISNQLYALLQAVPGMYAGEDELRQWCMRGQNRRVVVIDSTATLGNGALAVFTAAGRQVVPVTEENLYDLARTTANGGMVLFKTPGHWERVQTIH